MRNHVSSDTFFTHYTYRQPAFADYDPIVYAAKNGTQKYGTFRMSEDKDMRGKTIYRFCVVDVETGEPWPHEGMKSADYLERLAPTREDGLPLDKKIAVKGFCDVWLSDAMIEKLWQSMNARKQLMKQVGLPPDWADGPIDMNSGKAPCTPGVRKILDSLSPEQSRILTRGNSISNELVGNADFNLEVTHHCDRCGRVAANLEWTEDEDESVQISFLEHER